jgi:PPOX class probable F420-dependent enzyme
MRLPPLTDQELKPFLREGMRVAKLATHNEDGSIRITPLTYGIGEDGEIIFSTWQNSDAVRNLRRDGRASVLIDKVDQPYAGVHYTGQAETGPETCTAEEHAETFGRYVGDFDQAAESYRILTSLGLGERAFIRFRPDTVVTWDFGKIPGA